MHCLEAGFESPDRPLILLLHGFPELAYSWRKVMVPLAGAGYHVVAPDQRGYGRTLGWDSAYDGDVGSFRLLNLVRDALGLVFALGYTSAAAVVGHDFGSPVAAWCAVARPDVFRSVVLMSAPFGGAPPPRIPSAEASAGSATRRSEDIHAGLAALSPPRLHYQWYFSARQANRDMLDCEQGLRDFLRAYYHVKSADWPYNRPVALAGWRAEELARLPCYYVMERGQTMPQTVAPHMPTEARIGECRWLTNEELDVYADEFGRTGFQGGLNWYRCVTSAQFTAELSLFAGRTIDVAACFVAGQSDWGIHQTPGALKAMERRACRRYQGTHLVPGAGHWVQQEQPERVSELLIRFVEAQSAPRSQR